MIKTLKESGRGVKFLIYNDENMSVFAINNRSKSIFPNVLSEEERKKQGNLFQ